MTISPLKQKARFFLRRTFDIREGELDRALLMQLNIFLIITTLLIVKPAVNGLFLSTFGVSHLPYAFILVAIVASIVSTTYSHLLRKMTLSKVMNGTLVGSVISLLFFGVFLKFNIQESLVLYLFYIWVAIFALLTTSQFWVLANVVFNAREAKRLFGFVGAGAIVGGIFGGYLTSVLTQVISSEFLPFICAGFLSICIPLTRRIWKKEVLAMQTTFQQKKKIRRTSFRHPAVQIMHSRHLTFIAVIVGLSAVVAKLVDYQFGAVASSLIADPDELTAFFGFWFSTFNVISLLMQLFVTKKIVGTFGVGSALFLLPGSIFVAVLLLTFMPGLLLAAVFLKMADGGLKQSINKAAMELLIIPIPQEVKKQTKTFIDVFVDSLATGISGLLLIFIVKGLDLSTTAINMMIVVFLLLWMYTAYLVRKEYFKSFRQKIDFVKEHKKKTIDINSDSVIGGMRRVLEEGNDKQIAYILQKVREHPDKRLFDAIHQLLQHPSDTIRAAAIQNLYFFKNKNLSSEIEAMVDDPSQKIKIAVLDYLLSHASDNRFEIIQNYLNHPDYRISYAALVSLARETRINRELKSIFQLEERILQRATDIKSMAEGTKKQFCIIGVLKAIGYSGIPELYDIVEIYIAHEQMPIARQAVRSAGDTMHPRFLDVLMKALANEQLVVAARDALLHYGDGILDVFVSAVNDQTFSLDTIRLIPSVAKQIPLQLTVEFLLSLLDYPDLMVRQEALRGLNTLRNKHRHLAISSKLVLRRILNEAHHYQQNLSVLYAQVSLHQQGLLGVRVSEEEAEVSAARAALVQVLEKRLDRNLERIFRLLGLTYNSADIVSIYKGLHSNLPDIQMNALEFLDNLLEPGLKKTLIPIVETSMLETISEVAIKNLNLEIPSEFDCLKMLLTQPDIRIRQSVLYLIGKLNDPAYITVLEDFEKRVDEKSRPIVEALLEEMAKSH